LSFSASFFFVSESSALRSSTTLAKLASTVELAPGEAADLGVEGEIWAVAAARAGVMVMLVEAFRLETAASAGALGEPATASG